MSNSLKGDVPLTLSDGREFTLVLDMEAMLSVEDATGSPLPEVMAKAAQGFFTAIAALVQAAFQRHHPEIQRSDVLDMMVTDRDLLAEALGEATDRAFPNKSGSSAGGNGGKRRPGKNSGRSGAK